jgi:hypothetical protein
MRHEQGERKKNASKRRRKVWIYIHTIRREAVVTIMTIVMHVWKVETSCAVTPVRHPFILSASK